MFCHIVASSGKLYTVELALTTPISVNDLRQHEKLKPYLHENHKCFRDLNLLDDNAMLDCNDTVSFLMKTTLDAATWRQHRLQKKS